MVRMGLYGVCKALLHIATNTALTTNVLGNVEGPHTPHAKYYNSGVKVSSARCLWPKVAEVFDRLSLPLKLLRSALD